MELRHLRYFLALTSAESFTKASETLHVSQPSLSVQIRDLEVELGTRLLDRLGRKVMLTQAGELFRDHAQRAIRELEQATQLVQELQGAQRGRLVVGTLASVNSYLIAPLGSQFTQRFPGIHLQVHSLPSAGIVTGLLANRLDVGICLLPVTQNQLTTVPLLDEQLVLVAPAPSPDPISPAHAGSRWASARTHAGGLLPAEDSGSGMRKGADQDPSCARDDPPEGILQAVTEGAGLTILPELYVRVRLPGSGLRTIDLYDPVPRHSVGLAYQANRYQNIAAREFGTLCRTTMTRLLSRPKQSRRSSVTTG